MTMSARVSFVAALSLGVLAAGVLTSARQAPPPPPFSASSLTLPAGFQAAVFAEKVDNARSMVLGPEGTVFVGSQYSGKVHAVVDRDGDHKAERVVLIASGLDQPNGVAMRNGALYVATRSRLLRFDDIEKHLDAPPAPVTVRADLPNPNAGHTWKYIAFGPDDLLYMSDRFDVQRLRAGGDDRRHRPDEARRLRHGGLRRRRAQQRRVRLAPGDARAVVHRQRPRHARRRRAERRTQHGPEGRPALRVPVLPSGGRRRSGVRRPARVFDGRAARPEARRARGGDWLHVLHRQHVSGQLQERGDHRPAWVVEPVDAERLSRDGGAHGWASGDGLRAAAGRLPARRERARWTRRDGRRHRPTG